MGPFYFGLLAWWHLSLLLDLGRLNLVHGTELLRLSIEPKTSVTGHLAAVVGVISWRLWRYWVLGLVPVDPEVMWRCGWPRYVRSDNT